MELQLRKLSENLHTERHFVSWEERVGATNYDEMPQMTCFFSTKKGRWWKFRWRPGSTNRITFVKATGAAINNFSRKHFRFHSEFFGQMFRY